MLNAHNNSSQNGTSKSITLVDANGLHSKHDILKRETLDPHNFDSSLLLIPKDRCKKDKKFRSSYSHSKDVKTSAFVNISKSNTHDPVSHKRRSQTYHFNFKDKSDVVRRSRSKRSRKSKRQSKIDNPFIPASSKVVSESETKDEGNIDFHVVGRLGENKVYTTEKAVNLKTGKPLVIKYFKVWLY